MIIKIRLTVLVSFSNSIINETVSSFIFIFWISLILISSPYLEESSNIISMSSSSIDDGTLEISTKKILNYILWLEKIFS